MATYPLATLAAQITAAGISAPSYAEILTSLQTSFQLIYGSDAYIEPDSQDGELLALMAQAISDANDATIAVFQSFAPSFAQGMGLSSLVKLNGLRRQAASYSTAVGDVVGQAGTVITNGKAEDVNGVTWDLPATVTIPSGGTITVTVTAEQAGAITAPAGTITKIATPTKGWQSFTNTAAAVPGAPVETDAALRQRQAASVSGPASAIIDAIRSAVGNVTGVTRSEIYENDTSATDANGIPAHSISAVVEGGTVAAVGAAIQSRKPPGIQTYGTTTTTVSDPAGLPIDINFFELTQTTVYVALSIKALTGYVASTESLIVGAIVEFINTLGVGEDVPYWGLVSPANLTGTAALNSSGLTQAQLDALSATYEITALAIGTTPSPTGTTDLVIAFNAAAVCAAADVGVTTA